MEALNVLKNGFEGSDFARFQHFCEKVVENPRKRNIGQNGPAARAPRVRNLSPCNGGATPALQPTNSQLAVTAPLPRQAPSWPGGKNSVLHHFHDFQAPATTSTAMLRRPLEASEERIFLGTATLKTISRSRKTVETNRTLVSFESAVSKPYNPVIVSMPQKNRS